jgi:hypothetical protein
MLSIPKALEEKKYIPLREFISDVVMSRGNRMFLLTNLQAQIWGVTVRVGLHVRVQGTTTASGVCECYYFVTSFVF